MMVQISSGQGPVECSVAVELFSRSLLKEFENAGLISVNQDYSGNGYKSCIVDLQSDPKDIIGTVQWICSSPIRRNHKRKNWFITVSEVEEAEEQAGFSASDCVMETMHCGGHGGQNVNKVESGVRIRHIPSGIVVECTEERSQHMNKQKALRKLQALLVAGGNLSELEATKHNWKEHTDLVRGNPVRVYEGMEFRRIR